MVFVGTPDEIARNAFHAPPLHSACADELLRDPGADPAWQVVTTAGFEFVRPGREDDDRRPTFQPNSLMRSSDAMRRMDLTQLSGSLPGLDAMLASGYDAASRANHASAVPSYGAVPSRTAASTWAADRSAIATTSGG